MPLRIDKALSRLAAIRPAVGIGKLTRIMPTWLEADGPNVAVGTLCMLNADDNGKTMYAEVVRIDASGVALVPYSETSDLALGARVEAVAGKPTLPVGMEFLGRAVDALGQAIDNGPPIQAVHHEPLNPDPPLPLDRESRNEPVETGIKAIDALMPLGSGQRIGIFAASGVGKTSLLSQLIRQVQADVCVCCLVGERGREVESIWTNELSGEARARSVLVAATSDQAAAVRVRAVHQAIAIARHFRAQGLSVFLVLDSITRFAMALREVGLAAGEPPTLRAYTPSVFSIIPRVVEQAGALRGGGSITAVMTILAETDEVDDPLSELMKSLLDGHYVLSRDLAEKGHFPAIDPLMSVSRNAHKLMSSEHRRAAQRAQSLLALYQKNRTLIDAGLYSAGTNKDIDDAIKAQPLLEAFTRQKLEEAVSAETTLAALHKAVD